MASMRTTAVGGALLLAWVVLTVLQWTQFGLAVTEQVVVPLSGDVVAFLTAFVFLVALTVLAVGLPGERGIAGRSRPGIVALIVLGAIDLAVRLTGLLPATVQTGGAPLLLIGIGLPVVGALAVVVAAVAVARSGAVAGYARWGLVPLALLVCVTDVVELVPAFVLGAPQVWVPAFEVAAWLRVVLVAALAVGLLLSGRTADVRARARLINERW